MANEKESRAGDLRAASPTPSEIRVDHSRDAAIVNTTRTSSILMMTMSGLALLSDGYNIQVVGYMYPILAQLYPEAFTSDFKTRLSNALLVGGIVGILFFGWAIDRLGRRMGIFWSTFFLVLGVALTAAAHGRDSTGLFWMMVIGRGVSGFGFGGMNNVRENSLGNYEDANSIGWLQANLLSRLLAAPKQPKRPILVDEPSL